MSAMKPMMSSIRFDLLSGLLFLLQYIYVLVDRTIPLYEPEMTIVISVAESLSEEDDVYKIPTFMEIAWFIIHLVYWRCI